MPHSWYMCCCDEVERLMCIMCYIIVGLQTTTRLLWWITELCYCHPAYLRSRSPIYPSTDLSVSLLCARGDRIVVETSIKYFISTYTLIYKPVTVKTTFVKQKSYSVGHKKTCHFILGYKFRVPWRILTFLVPMETGINTLQCTYLSLIHI